MNITFDDVSSEDIYNIYHFLNFVRRETSDEIIRSKCNVWRSKLANIYDSSSDDTHTILFKDDDAASIIAAANIAVEHGTQTNKRLGKSIIDSILRM